MNGAHGFAAALTPKSGPELFFGLVSPTGTDAEQVCDVLTAVLSEVGYSVQTVSISGVIDSVTGNRAGMMPLDEKIRHLMTEGTGLRRKANRRDIAALLAVSAIWQVRSEKHEDDPPPDIPAEDFGKIPLSKTAYILRSLKTPEEVFTLRDIYGQAFNLISIYSSESDRITGLSKRIASSRRTSDPYQFRAVAQDLIKIDRDEGEQFGQRVRETFPLADYFLQASKAAEMRSDLRRFVRLVFADPFITPTRDEYAMFLARGVAMRSADLSRQVGAVIAQPSGDVIAAGCNDVPRAGGGLYWESDVPDGRDFTIGQDSAAVTKRESLVEFVARLSEAGLIRNSDDDEDGSEGGNPPSPEALADEIISGRLKDEFKGAQLLSVIEYGRSVHAEMAAITDSARRGVPIQGATLYSTTFPCHLCARHIISSGVTRVVYIEPYPKSKAQELFEDSMVEGVTKESNKVVFEPFVGVAPGNFFHLFEMGSARKDETGKAKDWENLPKNPKFKLFVTAYLMIEDEVLRGIVNPFLSSLNQSTSGETQ